MFLASLSRDPRYQRPGCVKRGTACTWKFGTQNIYGKRQFFSPRGQLAWTTTQALKNKRGKEKERSPRLLEWGLRHGPSYITFHPIRGWPWAPPDTKLLRSAPGQGDGAAFPKIIIIPQRRPHHLPVKTRAIRACSSSLVKSHLNEGRALLGGRGEPSSAATCRIIVGQDYGAITVLYAAAIQLLKYKCWIATPGPTSTHNSPGWLLRVENKLELSICREGWKGNVAAGRRREGAGLGWLKIRQQRRAAGEYQGASDPEWRGLLSLWDALFIPAAAASVCIHIKRQRTSQLHSFIRKSITKEPARAAITCLQVILITEAETNYVVR